MEIRTARPEDLEALKALWGYCFERPGEPFFEWFFQKYYQPNNAMCLIDNGMLNGCAHIPAYQLSLRGAKLTAGYLVGVAVDPAARQAGAGRRLLAACLAEMNRRQYPVSVLMPSRAEYYYPMEWEFCYHHLQYTVPTRELKSVAVRSGCWERVFDVSGWRELDQVYRAFHANRHGYVVRTEDNWRDMMEENSAERGHIYLWRDEMGPGAYLFYVLEDRKLTVVEAAYTGKKAQEAFLYFLYGHKYQADQVQWDAPLDDWVCLRLPNPKEGVAYYPFLSGRLVNLQQALEQAVYPPSLAGKAVMAVADPLAPWNEGVFLLEIAKGRGRVTATDAAPELEIGIGALTQLYFGRLGIRDLIRAGRVLSSDEKALLFLDAAFPAQANYINEYF